MGKEKQARIKKANDRRHRFLKEQFFKDTPEIHKVREVGNWILVQQWNEGTKRWEVAIWESKNYHRVQSMHQQGMFN